MTIFLDRVDSVPVQSEDFTFEFEQWLTVTVDSLNETLQIIENVNFIGVQVEATPYGAGINNTYLITNAATTTINLPAVAPLGAVVRIVGLGVGGWILVPGAGQTIKVAGSSAAVSIASTSRYDCISIICVVENTTWVTTSSETAGFVIT